MKVITFPDSEQVQVKSRLEGGKSVHSVRVDKELGKYKKGESLETQWGQKVTVVTVRRIEGGLSSLKEGYPYFSELDDEMINTLKGYDEMDIIEVARGDRNR